jgi:hypothetical protein
LVSHAAAWSGRPSASARGPDHGGEAVRQCFHRIEQVRCALVQVTAQRGTQTVVDSPVDERMVERHPVAVRRLLLADQACQDRFVQRVDRVGQAGKRGGSGQAGRPPEHGRSLDHLLSGLAQRLHPGKNDPGQATWGWQPAAIPLPFLRSGFLQQSAAVQRAAAGMVAQAGSGPGGDLGGAQRPAQRGDLGGGKAAQPDPARAVVAGDEPAPALPQPAKFTGPGGHQPQRPVALHPAQREHQGSGRTAVSPVQVVDGDHGQFSRALDLADQGRQIGSGAKRIRLR